MARSLTKGLKIYKRFLGLIFTQRDISCLRYRSTLRFGFFTHLWSIRTAMVFRYKGIMVTGQEKCNFFCLRFIFACRLVLYLCACAGENPEILRFCVSEIRIVRFKA